MRLQSLESGLFSALKKPFKTKVEVKGYRDHGDHVKVPYFKPENPNQSRPPSLQQIAPNPAPFANLCFVQFNINIGTVSDDWSLQRRFREFEELGKRLTRSFPSLVLPQLPDKNSFGPVDLQKREQALDVYPLPSPSPLFYSPVLKLGLDLSSPSDTIKLLFLTCSTRFMKALMEIEQVQASSDMKKFLQIDNPGGNYDEFK